MINKRKFWGWVGKVLLLAIPAAISGYASYMKSKVEADAKATASYETLQKAFTGLREDYELLAKRTEGLEAKEKESTSSYRILAPPPVRLGPTTPLVLLPPDAGTGSIGLGNAGTLGHGSGVGRGRPPHKKRAELPERFEDAVHQYKIENEAKK